MVETKAGGVMALSKVSQGLQLIHEANQDLGTNSVKEAKLRQGAAILQEALAEESMTGDSKVKVHRMLNNALLGAGPESDSALELSGELTDSIPETLGMVTLLMSELPQLTTIDTPLVTAGGFTLTLSGSALLQVTAIRLGVDSVSVPAIDFSSHTDVEIVVDLIAQEGLLEVLFEINDQTEEGSLVHTGLILEVEPAAPPQGGGGPE
jgi:hypothetical protein